MWGAVFTRGRALAWLFAGSCFPGMSPPAGASAEAAAGVALLGTRSPQLASKPLKAFVGGGSPPQLPHSWRISRCLVAQQGARAHLSGLAPTPPQRSSSLCLRCWPRAERSGRGSERCRMWWRLQLLVRLLLLALLAWHACNGRPVGPQARVSTWAARRVPHIRATCCAVCGPPPRSAAQMGVRHSASAQPTAASPCPLACRPTMRRAPGRWWPRQLTAFHLGKPAI